jgi:hypothetical protein
VLAGEVLEQVADRRQPELLGPVLRAATQAELALQLGRARAATQPRLGGGVEGQLGRGCELVNGDPSNDGACAGAIQRR